MGINSHGHRQNIRKAEQQAGITTVNKHKMGSQHYSGAQVA